MIGIENQFSVFLRVVVLYRFFSKTISHLFLSEIDDCKARKDTKNFIIKPGLNAKLTHTMGVILNFKSHSHQRDALVQRVIFFFLRIKENSACFEVAVDNCFGNRKYAHYDGNGWKI